LRKWGEITIKGRMQKTSSYVIRAQSSACLDVP
jgi:hypothetical protein